MDVSVTCSSFNLHYEAVLLHHSPQHTCNSLQKKGMTDDVLKMSRHLDFSVTDQSGGSICQTQMIYSIHLNFLNFLKVYYY